MQIVQFTEPGFPQFFRYNYKIGPSIQDGLHFNVLSTQSIIVISVNSDSTLTSLDTVLERLENIRPSKDFPQIMKHESSLQCSQEAAKEPYPEATESRRTRLLVSSRHITRSEGFVVNLFVIPNLGSALHIYEIIDVGRT
jgi:hypothetical protein